MTPQQTRRILLVIFVIVISVWFFFSDLKVQLFDLPILEAKRQSAVNIIVALPQMTR